MTVFAPEFVIDPYPEIARLCREEHMALWFVTRHDDVKRRALVDAMCDFLPTGAEIRAVPIELRPMGMFERPVTFPVDFSADLPLDAPRTPSSGAGPGR